MRRDDLNDLAAFVAVADARSFTHAAAQLGLSPSALSHAMRMLEARLGVRLLARTTRSVRATEAGERLLRTLRPAFEDIGAGLAALDGLRDRPAGTVRVTTPRHAAATVLWPALPGFLAAYPDVRAEVTVDEGLTDIIANRHDAGIRFGGNVARDMVAVRAGPDVQTVVVGSPDYLARHPAPDVPGDLAGHRCIGYRLATSGTLWPWEFTEAGRLFRVRVDGPLVFNDGGLIRAAALAGQGLACMFEDKAADDAAAGRLVRLLAPWCPVFPGYHLYHPSRRQVPPALATLISALRGRLPLLAEHALPQ